MNEPEDVVRARLFELVDGENRTRAHLGTWQSGHGILLYDSHGTERIRIEINADMPQVWLKGPAGEVRVGLYVTDNACPALTMHNAHGRSEVRVFVEDVGPCLEFRNPEGKGSAIVQLCRGNPLMSLTNARGVWCLNIETGKEADTGFECDLSTVGRMTASAFQQFPR